MARQPLVYEGVIRIQKIHHTAVFTHDALEEELGFFPHGLAQIVVIIGEDLWIGRRVLEISQEQPLLGEVVHQRVGAAVGQHPHYLLLQHRVLVQLPFTRQFQKFLVWRTAPQEKRQARGEGDIAELIGRIRGNPAGIRLETEQELRARQDELERRFDSSVETAVAIAPPLIKTQGRFQIRILDGPSISLAKQSRDDFARARQLFLLALGSADEYLCA